MELTDLTPGVADEALGALALDLGGATWDAQVVDVELADASDSDTVAVTTPDHRPGDLLVALVFADEAVVGTDGFAVLEDADLVGIVMTRRAGRREPFDYTFTLANPADPVVAVVSIRQRRYRRCGPIP